METLKSPQRFQLKKRLIDTKDYEKRLLQILHVWSQNVLSIAKKKKKKKKKVKIDIYS